MYHHVLTSLDVLYARLMVLGRLLSALCCLWIAVVGTVLVRELTPNDLENHRAPVIQERVNRCEGDFARRYDCANAILIDGGNHGATQLLARMGVTLILPSVAWVMWRGVMARAERLRKIARHAENDGWVSEATIRQAD